MDHIVVADEADHPQTFCEADNPSYYSPVEYSPLASRAEESLAEQVTYTQPMPLDPRRIIAARACDELQPGAIANLGIGMPEGVARIAAERGLLSSVTLTLESGPIGGMPAGGLSFGAAVLPKRSSRCRRSSISTTAADSTSPRSAPLKIDPHGNVNVSKFGSACWRASAGSSTFHRTPNGSSSAAR